MQLLQKKNAHNNGSHPESFARWLLFLWFHSLILNGMYPSVFAYFEAEEDGFATFFVAVPEVGMAKVIHLATWRPHHRAVTAALKTLFPNPSPSMGKGFSPLRGGVRGGLSFQDGIAFVLLPRAFEAVAAGDADGIVALR